MSTLNPARPRTAGSARPAALDPAGYWPLAGLIVLAAALRFSTLGLQSFWYDEAFTPVHVLHASLSATLRAMVHSENSPPLWYLIAWLDARVLGDGEVALRLPSAIAGVAIVPVAWAIGRELQGRATALVCGALVAVNPLLVWYAQEARVYSLYALASAVLVLCFLRATRHPTRGRMTAFAASAAIALLTHYFAVFLIVPMGVWLLARPSARRPALPALALVGLVAAALLPLALAQGGHGTQWIGRWALASRLQAIPQYYLTGYSGAPLGHGIELLVALPILGALLLALWRAQPAPGAGAVEPGPGAAGARGASDAVLALLAVTAASILLPLVLAGLGADYLAPRNLIGSTVGVAALIAWLFTAPRMGRAGLALAAAASAASLAISLDVNFSPRLQRGNWRGLARELAGAPPGRAITTVQLGSAPLQYYLPRLRGARAGATVTVREIDETGYAPLRRSAADPPAPGFRLIARLDVDGLIAYRFGSPVARRVPVRTLRAHVITLARPVVLVSGRAGVSL